MQTIDYSPVVKPVHIVTLTTDDTRDDFDYECLHMGPHTGCSYYEECGECMKAGTSGVDHDSDEAWDGETERHGVLHTSIDSLWMTYQGCVTLGYSDSVNEGLWDIFRKHGAGTFLLDVNYWGDEQWDVELLKVLS